MFKKVLLSIFVTILFSVSSVLAQGTDQSLTDFLIHQPKIVILKSTYKKLPMPMSKIDQLVEDGEILEENVYADFTEFGNLENNIKLFNKQAHCVRNQNTCYDLTDEEKVAIHTYSMYFYTQVNTILRGYSDENIRLIQPYTKAITSALNKTPIYSGIVYRIVHDFPGLKNYTPGTIITEKGYTSTSASKGFLAGYKKSAHLFIIKSKTGRDIHQLTAEDESEVLFEKNTKFRILSRTKTNGLFTIEMEEI